MNEKYRLPNQERLSVVLATILLGFALSQFIQKPESGSLLSVVGILIPINFNISTLITIAVAGMTATGTDWLLRDHPGLQGKSTVPHLLLPAITAWVQSVILNNMAETPFKWIAFLVGGIFLLIVILAEYIVIFPEDYRKPIAVSLLSALFYAVILALSVALDSTNQRLIIILPAVSLGTGILSIRIFQLQLEKEWPLLPSLATMLMVTQIATVLHYLPVSSLSFGLILLGALYFTITFTIGVENGTNPRRAAVEGLIPMLLVWVIALWIN